MENQPFVHILSDFPDTAPEMPVYRMLLQSRLPQARLIFTQQPFKPGDVIAPAVFLRLTAGEFPAGTLHICNLHIGDKLPEKYVYARGIEQHFLVPDNGVLGLAFPDADFEWFKLPNAGGVPDIFKNLYLPAADMIAGKSEFTLEPEPKPRRVMMQQPAINGNQYRLTVLYNDAQGNAYLNMQKAEFERITAGKRYKIRAGMRDEIFGISRTYAEVPEGTRLALFGYGDMLQIAVNGGSAAQYLGLATGKVVMLEIE